MKISSLYFILCATLTCWLTYADYRGKVPFSLFGSAARKYPSGYQHK